MSLEVAAIFAEAVPSPPSSGFHQEGAEAGRGERVKVRDATGVRTRAGEGFKKYRAHHTPPNSAQADAGAACYREDQD